jgi:hypothetical protein
MGAATIQQMATRVGQLLETRLKIRGATLADKLRKAKRRLPRKIYAAAEYLAQASHLAQNPKMISQLNEGEIAQAYDLCVKYLTGTSLSSQRRGTVLMIITSIAVSVVFVMILAIAVLRWRGLI